MADHEVNAHGSAAVRLELLVVDTPLCLAAQFAQPVIKQVIPGCFKIRMIPRSFLATLVFAIPILIVVFAVVLGASLLTQALGDVAGARILFWTAMTALILLVIDALLLLGALGLRAIDVRHDRTDDEIRS